MAFLTFALLIWRKYKVQKLGVTFEMSILAMGFSVVYLAFILFHLSHFQENLTKTSLAT